MRSSKQQHISSAWPLRSVPTCREGRGGGVRGSGSSCTTVGFAWEVTFTLACTDQLAKQPAHFTSSSYSPVVCQGVKPTRRHASATRISSPVVPTVSRVSSPLLHNQPKQLAGFQSGPASGDALVRVAAV